MNTMTKQEAREILNRHNKWRRGGKTCLDPVTVGLAIDTLTAPNEIAQSIREAAIKNDYLSSVASHIVYAFAGPFEATQFDTIQRKTFMLFVAEALES